ncbi:hypothetical protein E4U42_002864 [Claviceps africana]|uniref:L-type lectin-like domain-containing protein n=1 Tax=Claviceps africana TaxID=83212 RepID=A0A8K0JEP0_9HYPO|nr:hypothetical protein E4U42_002864 [Claviceps africana]
MRFFSSPVAFATLLSATVSQAQTLINEQSFGHSGHLTVTDGRIPHFTLSGRPQQPEILSNKIIFTPLAPGNQRSAIWADSPLTRSTWVADLDFRAGGADRAGGNLNIWFARRGKEEVGANSVYTARKFEGLVLVVDTHGGSGGMIRGFLNDGTVDYVNQAHVDKLAFGQCDYYYRNLGRPSQIKLRQTLSNFRVEVDGRLCFETDKVSLPAGYHFGITAATPDNPDSFEIFKFVVMSDSTVSSEGNHGQHQQNDAHHGQQQQEQQHGGTTDTNDHAETIPDQPAENFQTSMEQFRDLHSRIQLLQHQTLTLLAKVTKHVESDAERTEEMKKSMETLNHDLGPLQQLGDIQTKIRKIEAEMFGMRQDIRSALSAHGESVQQHLAGHHSSLSQALSDSVPGHGKLMLLFVGTQLIVVACYVTYKRHRATSPKKYL